MSEKGPKIRIVGDAHEDYKEKVREEIEESFFHHNDSLSKEDWEEIIMVEHAKSEKEIELINFANQETNRLMQEAGVNPYNIPLENFHLIPSEKYQNATSSESHGAATFYYKQAILFNAERFKDELLLFGVVAFHEVLHLKSHFSVEAEEGDDWIAKSRYREGVSVISSQKAEERGEVHSHFVGLHEAIVSSQTKKTIPAILNQMCLKKEKEWLESEKARKIKRRISKIKNIPEDDIYWVSRDAEDYEGSDYLGQRRVLNYVCTEIQKQFPDDYETVEDVFNEFLRAQLTGRLIGIGQLVENTFGKGGFRILGDMREDKESPVLCMESLRKARSRKLKPKKE